MIADELRHERLTQLRRVIEAAPEDRFHMQRFSERAECGTAYCAAGWTAIDPWFRANTDIGKIFEVQPDGQLELLVLNPFWGLADLFGLEDDEASALFGGELDGCRAPHCITKAEVLANIDRLLAGDPAEEYACLIERDDDDDDD